MSTTKLDIKEWFEAGIKLNATHMIVVSDTFNFEDYPAYVLPDEDVHVRINHYRLASMQAVREVYDLNQDKTKQLNEARSFNFPPWPEPESDSD